MQEPGWSESMYRKLDFLAPWTTSGGGAQNGDATENTLLGGMPESHLGDGCWGIGRRGRAHRGLGPIRWGPCGSQGGSKSRDGERMLGRGLRFWWMWALGRPVAQEMTERGRRALG